MDYQVYILVNESGRRYIGYTENVVHRLRQHNRGDSKYTAKHGPWTLLWTSRTMSRQSAFNLERKLKNQKGGQGLRVLMDYYSELSGS